MLNLGLIRSAFAKLVTPSPATSLNLEAPPSPTVAEPPHAVASVPPAPIADPLVAELNKWAEKWEKCTPSLVRFLAPSPETRTSQMKAAASCTVGELLGLARDPLNKLGPHTIRFARSSGEECGVVDAEVSSLGLADELDRGASAVARVVSVATKDEKPRIVVAIVWNSPPAPPPQAGMQIVTDTGRAAWLAQWKKVMHSKVMGVAYNNDDGTSRQQFIRQCQVGELLDLVRDPDNPHSVNGTAIKIVRKNGEMLGHVQSEISEILAGQMDRGSKVEARITMLTGGTPDKPTRGVNIIIGQNHAPHRKRAKAEVGV